MVTLEQSNYAPNKKKEHTSSFWWRWGGGKSRALLIHELLATSSSMSQPGSIPFLGWLHDHGFFLTDPKAQLVQIPFSKRFGFPFLPLFLETATSANAMSPKQIPKHNKNHI
jgi:hypothetical protein